MGFLLSLLGKPKIAASVALLVAGLSIISVQTWRVSAMQRAAAQLKADLSQSAADLERTIDANAGAQKVIDSLTASVASWKENAETQRVAAAEALSRLERADASLGEANAEVSRLRGRDSGLASCDSLKSADVAAACPGEAQAIRSRAGVPR